MADENEVREELAPIPEAPAKPKPSEKKAEKKPEIKMKKPRHKPNPHALVKSFIK